MSHSTLDAPRALPRAEALNEPRAEALREPRDNLTPVGRFALPPFPQTARRSRFGLLSFILMVVLPTAAGIWYFTTVAARQFVTTSVVALRVGEEGDQSARSGTGSLVGSFGPPAGGPAVTQSYGLVNYIQSVPVMDDIIRSGVDIRAILSHPDADVWAQLPAGASQETLARYWKSMVHAEFEVTSGVVTIQTRAFTAQDSLRLSEAVLASSERLLNAVAERMHGDAVRYAEGELKHAERRLVTARSTLQSFRASSGVLDLGRSLGTTAELETKLRQDLMAAEGQAENLRTVVGQSGPMYAAAVARSRALRQQLTELERQTGRSSVVRDGAAGAGIMSQYEALTSEIQLAERYYSQVLDLLQQARVVAVRQGTYVLTFVRPVAAAEGLYPGRLQSSLIVGACAFLAWAVAMLLYRAVMDHA